MAPKDNISEHYRLLVEESLIQGNVSSPSFSLNQKEEDEIWKDVSIEMDLGEVWDGISNALDHFMPLNRPTGIILRSAAAVIVILISIIPVKKANVNPEIVITHIVQNEQAEKRTADIKNDPPAEPVTKSGDRMPDSPVKGNEYVKKEVGMDPVQGQKQSTNPAGIPLEKSEDPVAVPGEIPGDEDQPIPEYLIEIPSEAATVSTEMHYDRLEFDNQSSAGGYASVLKPRRKFSVGLAAMYKNTWLLNYDTFDGLKSGTLIATVASFSTDLGVSFNYALNEHWTLQNEGFFYSNTGQEYRDYVNGDYSKIDYALKYSTINLSVKYKFLGRENALVRTSINLMGGGYISLLQKANQRINGALKNVSAEYNTLDYGIRLVSEFEFYFSDHFSSGPGISLSYGIPNIYRGDFKPTHNCSAGFQVICYYRF